MSKSSLGQVVATPHALSELQRLNVEPLELTDRHSRLDREALLASDHKLNDQALIDGTRAFSVFEYDGVKFWVITEADRLSTCLMLPSDYRGRLLMIDDVVERDKSLGTHYNLPCQNCIPGKKRHTVLASVETAGDNQYCSWNASFQIVQCGGCQSVSFRTISESSADAYADDDGKILYPQDERLFPPRVENRAELGMDVWSLPNEVRLVYEETLKALSNDSPVLAGIGLRAMLETVCKEKQAPGRNLLQKIDSLVELKILTPGAVEILHKIRTLGNDAAHEVKPHSSEQLGLALDVIEHLLKEVYILPSKIKRKFDPQEPPTIGVPGYYSTPLPPSPVRGSGEASN
jgi:hypothetical protein